MLVCNSAHPLPAGRQLVSPFAPKGLQRHDGARPGASEMGGDGRRRVAPPGSRLSSAQAPSRAQPQDNGSDEDFLPFENQRRSGSQRSGGHARMLLHHEIGKCCQSAGRTHAPGLQNLPIFCLCLDVQMLVLVLGCGDAFRQGALVPLQNAMLDPLFAICKA